MVKLFITCVLTLFIVSLNEGESIQVIKTIIIEHPKVYYPLYDSGRVVGYIHIREVGKARVVEAYYSIVKALLDSACKDGVEIRVNSAYRTFYDQLLIRQRYVKHKNCKDDIDYLITASSREFYPETAKPGHSRHHSGIAYDFNTKDPNVYRWLQHNAIKYGFVRTIPEERWHWEYLPIHCDKYYYVKKEHWSWRINYKLKGRIR